MQEKQTRHTGRNIALIVGGGLVFAGGLAAYEKVPAVNQAVHRMVDKAFLSHLRGDQLASTDAVVRPETVFSNTSMEKRKISPQNTVRIVGEEGLATVLKKDSEGNPAYLFPLVIGDGETIEYDKEYPNRARVYNVKKGTPIIAGRDGYAFAWTTSVKGPDGRLIPATGGITTGIRVVFMGDDGYAHQFNVDTSGNMSNPDAKLKAQPNIPYLGIENDSGVDFTKGLPVQEGTLVGYANDDIKVLQIQEWAKEVVGNQINPAVSKKTSLNFALRGEPGATKLILFDLQN